MNGKLTTHVLDTSRGRPGAGIPVRLYRHDAERILLTETTTNSDGRCDSPLLEGADCKQGVYELEFDAGQYFRALDSSLQEPLFIDRVVLRFAIANSDEHYHVPLLVSPFSYSTYRGS